MTITPQVLTEVALQSLNTFGIAATARHFLPVTDPAQLAGLSAWAHLPRLVLGGGSNLILRGDFPGLVLHVEICGRVVIGEDQDHWFVQAGAGENWHEFVQWTLAQGMGGLENLSLIPGSAGAAPVQNIGAYGVELKDRFHSLTWFEFSSGVVHTLTDCQFGYRDSIFKHALRDRGMILSLTLALPKRWRPCLHYGELARTLHGMGLADPDPGAVSAAVCAIRSAKLPDPAQIGNAGSFFKNPVVPASTRERLLAAHPQLVSHSEPDGQYKLAAAWLIEQAGWKGRALGRVAMFQKQALVMVNLGGATGADVRELADAVIRDVERQFGVTLEPEPVFV